MSTNLCFNDKDGTKVLGVITDDGVVDVIASAEELQAVIDSPGVRLPEENHARLLLEIRSLRAEVVAKPPRSQTLPSNFQLGDMLRIRSRSADAFPVTAICFREGKVSYELDNGFFSSENVLPALQVVPS